VSCHDWRRQATAAPMMTTGNATAASAINTSLTTPKP
jgi:hypothetical protein